jgi:hypothetical protein
MALNLAAETSTSMGGGSVAVLIGVAILLIFAGGKGGRGR